MTSFLWATNGPQFDFAPFDGEPRVRYVIASLSRSGSNMLQRALWRTRLAGAPEEYFTDDYVHDFDARWSIVEREPRSFTVSGNAVPSSHVAERRVRHEG